MWSSFALPNAGGLPFEILSKHVSFRVCVYTVYMQIFGAYSFCGLLYPEILQKQFSWIKSFEFTAF